MRNLITLLSLSFLISCQGQDNKIYDNTFLNKPFKLIQKKYSTEKYETYYSGMILYKMNNAEDIFKKAFGLQFDEIKVCVYNDTIRGYELQIERKLPDTLENDKMTKFLKERKLLEKHFGKTYYGKDQNIFYTYFNQTLEINDKKYLQSNFYFMDINFMDKSPSLNWYQGKL